MITTWFPRPETRWRLSTATGSAARVDDVRIDVVRLASLTTDAIANGTQALLDGDLDEADRVVADDDAVDALRHAVEDECLRIFGRPASPPPTSASSAWP